MSSDVPTTDVFTLYGRYLAQTIIQRNETKHPPARVTVTPRHEDAISVGILGSGMAGLYTALMLAKAGIPFQILEATDRIGGRCFTHHFKDGGEWDYYDVGAMRFPLPQDGERGPHQRLKDLFEYLEIDLLEYIPETDQGRKYYNGVHARNCDKGETFKAEELHVPIPYVLAGVNGLATDYIERLTRPLLEDSKDEKLDGWKNFKQQYDQYSTRSYLQLVYIPSKELQLKFGVPPTGLPTSVVDWMETFDGSTGSYDRALTETVLDAIAFGVVGPKPEWRCIRGGTSVLPRETLRKVKEHAQSVPGMPSEIIVKNAPVTVIEPNDGNDTKSPLKVTAGGTHYFFSHVISAVPLPSFATIDTSKLSISPMQRSAIRKLQYASGVKVGMRFKSAWWKDDKQLGGQSLTDLPISTIIYPSHGEKEEPKVLIASYCWTSDADRLGALIDARASDDSPSNEKDAGSEHVGAKGILDDLVLRNLAAVHEVEVEFLRHEHVETHSWNWSQYPWTGGACALFGPGQYDLLYEALNTTAAENRLQWAGELLSVRHAWIVGALDSGWAAVARYLHMTDATRVKDFYQSWGTNDEWRAKSRVVVPGGRGPESDDNPWEENPLFTMGFTHPPSSIVLG